MTRSANEVMTLAAKAARGAGAPAGQASLFGRVALRHLIAGRDIGELTAALAALPHGPVVTLPQLFGELAERALQGQSKGKLPVGSLTVSYAEAQPYLCQSEMMPQAISVTLDLTQPAENMPIERVNLPETLAQELHFLSAKILVPESDASRLSGAGAGLTDND
jgi:hypothetical protein